MTATTDRVARAFARGLASYDRAALVQRRIATRLFAGYRAIAPGHCPGRILEAGFGSGHLTRHLLELDPARLWLNDLVARPLPGVAAEYLPGDIAQVPLPGRIDLVASASMIQWVEDPRKTVERLCRTVVPGGYLALSGFTPDHFPELRSLGSRAAAPSCLSAGGMAALLPPGWRIRNGGEWRATLHFPTALAVLQHLRATGVNARAGQFRSAAPLRGFMQRYETRHGTAQGVPLTYVACFLIAENVSKPAF